MWIALLACVAAAERVYIIATTADGARCLRPTPLSIRVEAVDAAECGTPVWQHLPTGELLNPGGGCLTLDSSEIRGGACEAAVKWRCDKNVCVPLVPKPPEMTIDDAAVSKLELAATVSSPTSEPETPRFEQLQFSKASDGRILGSLVIRLGACCCLG